MSCDKDKNMAIEQQFHQYQHFLNILNNMLNPLLALISVKVEPHPLLQTIHHPRLLNHPTAAAALILRPKIHHPILWSLPKTAIVRLYRQLCTSGLTVMLENGSWNRFSSTAQSIQ
ncbi:hypothetical protein ACOSQ4_004012 [Xanthoceras sorbifolium]